MITDDVVKKLTDSRTSKAIECVMDGSKRVLRLDKNFHVYIHGDSSKIQTGNDEMGNFIKLYYNNAE